MFEFYFAMAAVQVGMQLIAAQQRAKMMRQQAEVAKIQGQISIEQGEFQARKAREAGAEQSQFIRRKSVRHVGSMVTGTAAKGVELSGSPLDAIADQIWQDERAASVATTNAEAGAFMYESRGRAAAAGANAKADQLYQQAGYEQTAGWLNAAATGMQAYAGYQYHTGGNKSASPSVIE